jgi:hypothetical protein
METTTFAWASEEFGSCTLGDRRRNTRLVRIAAEMARRPAGRVTRITTDVAMREAMYRFVGNESVKPKEIGKSSAAAALVRAANEPFVFVPIDATSLSLTDDQKAHGFGVVGSRKLAVPGLHVMSALAVSPSGVPLGIVDQIFWARVNRSTRKSRKADCRPAAEKETRYWTECMTNVHSAVIAAKSQVVPWFQLDRGGDAGTVLFAGLRGDEWFTVRAAYDRRLASDADGERQYLRATIENCEPFTRYKLAVTGGKGRKERTADMVVRVTKVTIRLVGPDNRNERFVSANAVLTREEGTTPSNEKPIDWLLITNVPVEDEAGAVLVIRGYATRWRIEEFHKTWKTAACDVESTLLRDPDAVERLARIAAAVAVRILRLSYLARREPTTPALRELDSDQLRVLLALALAARYVKGDPPTLDAINIAQATQWIAQLGGYTGKSSGGPPGAIVIARGLKALEAATAGVIAVRKL